jgi:hypothetical protein
MKRKRHGPGAPLVLVTQPGPPLVLVTQGLSVSVASFLTPKNMCQLSQTCSDLQKVCRGLAGWCLSVRSLVELCRWARRSSSFSRSLISSVCKANRARRRAHLLVLQRPGESSYVCAKVLFEPWGQPWLVKLVHCLSIAPPAGQTQNCIIWDRRTRVIEMDVQTLKKRVQCLFRAGFVLCGGRGRWRCPLGCLGCRGRVGRRTQM